LNWIIFLQVANDSGHFKFKIRPGTYKIRITAVGFRPYEGNIEPVRHRKALFKLDRINLFMQPVEVRATRAGDNAPFTKTNISKREIEKIKPGTGSSLHS
jgi:iron complex outermembrane receptor protein